MQIIFLTIAVSFGLAAVFLAVFLWSAKSGQYDDLVTPGHRMLIDDTDTGKKDEKKEDKFHVKSG